MDFIMKDAMETMITRDQRHDDLTSNSSHSSTRQSSTILVFDDAVVNQVLDKLTGQQSGLQVIPIVGMGGIGKTTFARNIYANPLIVQHFDTLAWITISQEYSRRNILQLLLQEVKGSIKNLSEMTEDEIGENLYKHLWGRRYLIVMDDIWSVEAWNKVMVFFPRSEEGSRIMITTRLLNLTLEFSACHVFQMQFLDEDKSWNLLSKTVFGGVDCPVELEHIGKQIARKCRGLPLSIAVVGGLLKKSNMTTEYWMYTLRNLNLLINLEDNEYTLRVLRTSYKELPMRLKPCFLYMGVFPEDNEIKTSVLIKLWVAEGILKPIDGKSLEEVAKEYLKELMDRNLILIPALRWDGEARSCKIHDLLRDVCLREAQTQKFFRVLRQQKDHTLYRKENSLVRVYSSADGYDYRAIFEQANLRYLSLKLRVRNAEIAPRLFTWCLFHWNLQTLGVEFGSLYSPEPPVVASEMWGMPLLRHVMHHKFALPDPPNGEHSFVLENLQTLSRVKNFKFSDEVVRRLPNVKKLKVVYESGGADEGPNFHLNNVDRLQSLESFSLVVHEYKEYVRRNLVSFPRSLKKLILRGTGLSWEELTIRVGSLPFLRVLKLGVDACVGVNWETVEGQFCSLRVLQISTCILKYWETESAHFPCLEHLHLQFLRDLEEIPSSIGDITTLKSIRVEYCNKTAAHSAQIIKEEQQEYENEDLQVVIV